MKEILKKKTILYFVGLAAALIAIFAAIFYAVYSSSFSVYIPAVTAFLIIGAVIVIIALFLELLNNNILSSVLQVVPAIAVVLYSMAFGILLSDRLGMIGDAFNGIVLGRSGSLDMYMTMLVFMAVSAVAGIASCFSKQNKE